MNVAQLRDEYLGLVDRWCAPQFAHEPLEIRAIRAMLEMRACILDRQLVARGERPIRPLDSYPVEPEPRTGR